MILVTAPPMDPTQMTVAALFWLSAGLVFYTYAGYPLVVWLLSRWLGRRVEVPVGNDADLPSVSLLIAAYNEEAVIEERVRNALAMDYPPAKLEIVVGSDGSTDGTARDRPALRRPRGPAARLRPAAGQGLRPQLGLRQS